LASLLAGVDVFDSPEDDELSLDEDEEEPVLPASDPDFFA
jgi:hypothetical protein